MDIHAYKRPDLKQFLINLIVSGDSGIPLFLECGNGNDSDRAKESSTYSVSRTHEVRLPF